MVENLNRYAFIIISCFLTSGCVTQIEERSSLEEEKTIDNRCLESKEISPEIPSLFSVPSNLQENGNEEKLRQNKHLHDLEGAIRLVVNKMKHVINSDSIILIDSINNCTHSHNFLNYEKVTAILRNAVKETGIFTLISEQQLKIAKKKLGLSSKDRLNTISKTIGIARSIGANYIFCSSIMENLYSPILQIQLISVQTGEIIWSDKIKI